MGRTSGEYRRLVLAVLALGGCDPGFTLKGRAITDDGAPVSSAEVLVVCKDGAAFEQATTGTDGHFSASRLGSCNDECEIVVRSAGFESYRALVSRHCNKHAQVGRGCLSVEVEARLKRLTR